jgi:chromate reductase
MADDYVRSKGASVSTLELARDPSLERVMEACNGANAFIFGTGTYWDSWGSAVQRFFEMTAHTEASDTWLGKPVGAIITAHAVGAKGVLSRLLGICNQYGMSLPPFAGMTYTWANDVAIRNASEHLGTELWRPADVEVVAHNVLEMANGGNNWRKWPTSEGLYGEKWLHVYSNKES